MLRENAQGGGSGRLGPGIAAAAPGERLERGWGCKGDFLCIDIIVFIVIVIKQAFPPLPGVGL